MVAEPLEQRALLAVTISISDASVMEDADQLVGQFADVVISDIDGPKSIREYDGDFYVTSSFASTILRYDGNTFEFLGEFVGPGSGGLDNAIDMRFHNDVLYVSSANTDEVLKYDAVTGAPLGALATQGAHGLNNPRNLLVHDDDLYIASWSDEIHRYDLTTGLFKDVFIPTTVGMQNPAGMAFSQDGKEFFVSNWESRNVLVFDAETGGLLRELIPPQAERLADITFAEDGSLLVISVRPKSGLAQGISAWGGRILLWR